ncbi:carotenoid oxygenase family protein [Sporichthya brevicatena]|uniref:carotenoid oxygenase family protein n=1 Tax=Sporichthya brevicatena TaxID=171442 RepID=UPI003CD07313
MRRRAPEATVTATAENPYLTDNFGPVATETTAVDLPVTGTLPAHLDGRYLRNGPNPVTPVDPTQHHWFLGTGMVHGVRIRDGKAEWYRNRFVRSADVAAALGEQPRPGAKPHVGWDFPANTNVVVQGGRTFAIVEAGGRPYELTDDLETVGACDFDGTLPGGYTAHPKRDPATGELHAVSYYWGWGNQVQYTVLGTDARVKRVENIAVTGSPMMHDFSLTENHVVLYDLPCVFDLDPIRELWPRPIGDVARWNASLFVGKRRTPDPVAAFFTRKVLGAKAPKFPYRWDPNYPARVGVMPRTGTAKDVRWFEIEPCYVFHPLNAYDDGDKLVLDVVRHPRMFDAKPLGPDEGPSTLDRWTVDLTAGKVLAERRSDLSQEFPRVDERVVGRRHRYGYAVGFRSTRADALIRHDLVTGDATRRTFSPGTNLSEFLFVPDADDSPEDRGTLMGFAYDPGRDASDLLLLDSQTLETVAAVHLPARVPAGFHGNWAPTVG